jgi:anti-sigma B factor antagonist
MGPNMFSISVEKSGDVVLSGRFDTSQAEVADAIFQTIASTTRVDFHKLEYISSVGLGILLKTQKRLSKSGHGLILTNMNKLVRDVFHIARFDVIFTIDDPA